ncbi:MAG TPA: tetratricopeptide repeat protein, partial [Candidatus Obscuribacterales bacterium]
DPDVNDEVESGGLGSFLAQVAADSDRDEQIRPVQEISDKPAPTKPKQTHNAIAALLADELSGSTRISEPTPPSSDKGLLSTLSQLHDSISSARPQESTPSLSIYRNTEEKPGRKENFGLPNYQEDFASSMADEILSPDFSSHGLFGRTSSLEALRAADEALLSALNEPTPVPGSLSVSKFQEYVRSKESKSPAQVQPGDQVADEEFIADSRVTSAEGQPPIEQSAVADEPDTKEELDSFVDGNESSPELDAYVDEEVSVELMPPAEDWTADGNSIEQEVQDDVDAVRSISESRVVASEATAYGESVEEDLTTLAQEQEWEQEQDEQEQEQWSEREQAHEQAQELAQEQEQEQELAQEQEQEQEQAQQLAHEQEWEQEQESEPESCEPEAADENTHDFAPDQHTVIPDGKFPASQPAHKRGLLGFGDTPKPKLTKDLVAAREAQFAEELKEAKELAQALKRKSIEEEIAEEPLPAEPPADVPQKRDYQAIVLAAAAAEGVDLSERIEAEKHVSFVLDLGRRRHELKAAARSWVKPGEFKAALNKCLKHGSDRRIWTAVACISLIFIAPAAICYCQLNNAMLLYEKKNYKEALNYVDAATAISPLQPEAYVLRGRCLLGMGDTREASKAFTAAIKLKPDYVDALEKRGATHLVLGNTAGAIEDYLKVFEIIPDPANRKLSLYLSLGNAYFAASSYADALKQFQYVLKRDPKNMRAYIGLAACYQAQLKYKDAVATYDKALSVQPNNVDVLLERGRCLGIVKDYAGAESSFLTAMNVAPKDPAPYVYRGNFYAAIRDSAKAFSDYEHAMAIDPKYIESYKARAKLYQTLGDYKSALADYEKIKQITSGLIPLDVCLSRVKVFTALNMGKQCLEELTNYKDRFPKSKDFRVAYANVLLSSKKYDAAIAEATSAIELDAHFASAFLVRGIAEYEKGDLVKSFKDLTAAIELNPHQPEAFLRRGNIYVAQQQFASGQEDFEKALKLNPSLSAAADGLKKCTQSLASMGKLGFAAWLKPTKALLDKLKASDYSQLLSDGQSAYAKGDLPVSIITFEEAIKRDPNCPVAHRMLALSYAACGQYGRAVRHFEYLKGTGKLEVQDRLSFAEALRKLGDGKGAVFQYEEYLKIRPVAVSARMELAQTYASLGDTVHAIEVCSKTLQMPISANAHAAFEEFKRALENRSSRIDTYYSDAPMSEADIEREAAEAGNGA